MTDIAISGTRRQYKEMADGTIRVSIDIDPSYKAKFLELFGEIDMPVALAPLKADFEKEEKPKGGPLSKSAARMCENEEFQKFMDIWLAKERIKIHDDDDNIERCACALRSYCRVDSRASLDFNQEAAKRFHELMREFNQWRAG